MSGSKTKAKVVLVGDSGAGKSSLLAAFAGEAFDPAYKPTVGVEFKARTVRIDDGDGHIGTVKLTVWDSAGEGQNYKAIQSTYYKGARCAVIVFDVTSQESFQSVERWVSEIEKYAEGPMPIVLVATKTDLWEERVVTGQDADEWASEQAEVIPVHEISSKDGSNIDELVSSIGGVIARTSANRGSFSSKRDTLKAAAEPSMMRQQVQSPPSISASTPVPPTPSQSRPEQTSVESTTGYVSRLERQELQQAIEEQQGVVAEARSAAEEVGTRVEQLESAFGTLQQKFEEVLQRMMKQQRENTDAIATLQDDSDAQEQLVADEALAREKLSQDSLARGQRNEQALASLGGEIAELNAAVSRVQEEVQCATRSVRQTDVRLQAVEEAVKTQEYSVGSEGSDAPPRVGRGDSPEPSAADSAAIIEAVENRLDVQLADAQHLQAANLQSAETRLKDELARLLREGLSGYEKRLNAVQEQLAKSSLESAGCVEEARKTAKSSATDSVAKAVQQAAQLVDEEVRRLEAEWESRMTDLATDFETAAMLGGAHSQSDGETEERVNQLSKDLSATKASLAVNKTELELQQGEIAVLTNRAETAEEDNAELRARVDKLQSMLLAMGDSPFASPIAMQAGGASLAHENHIGTGIGKAVSPARGISDAGTGGSVNVPTGISLRLDHSAINRTTTEEIEADLMGTVNFNASYGDISPMVSQHVGADLSGLEFALDSTREQALDPELAQQQLHVEERPWPSQRRASQDMGQSTGVAEGNGVDERASPPRRPRTAPPGWHDELERMLTEEKNESSAAMEAFAQGSQRRLSFRASKRRPVAPSDGTLRGYIRHCYDGCDDEPEMEQMREELRRMVEMFAAAGKIATTNWVTLPPPI